MILSERLSKYFAPLFLYLLWAFLRFWLMPRIHGLVLHSTELGQTEKILFSHALIVFEALILFLPFFIFKKRRWVQGFQASGSLRQSVQPGVAYGLLIFITIIPVALYFGMKLSAQFSLPSAVGNLLSNGAEEIIYRGILLAAAMTLFRKSWISIIISSMAFGLAHWDLPFLFQTYITIVGLILGYLYLRTKSLFAPYIAHMIADLLADSFFH
jgi:membrane protease YdiL (CAAX protease family)